MPSSRLLIPDAASRIWETQTEHKKKLDAYHRQVRRLKNACFLRKVQVRRGGKTYVYEKYYRYGYFKIEDGEEIEAEVPPDLTNTQRYRFIKEHALKRRMVYVGGKKPKVELPDPPGNPLAGLDYETRGHSVILDRSVYLKHRDLFRDLEVFELK